MFVNMHIIHIFYKNILSWRTLRKANLLWPPPYRGLVQTGTIGQLLQGNSREKIKYSSFQFYFLENKQKYKVACMVIWEHSCLGWVISIRAQQFMFPFHHCRSSTQHSTSWLFLNWLNLFFDSFVYVQNASWLPHTPDCLVSPSIQIPFLCACIFVLC